MAKVACRLAEIPALKDLSSHLSSISKEPQEDELKAKVDAHWAHISTQISRLKALRENLSSSPPTLPQELQKTEKVERPQAFDLFSPIPVVEEKQSKVTENMKNQPRVLSLDSGNFSVASKQTDLLTVSGDALKPVVVHNTCDTISTVSMNDITHWYNVASYDITKSMGPILICRKCNGYYISL
ncbi:uncharacterized protein LOC114364451 [Ostrinia furnacalis]|uniref:uncharacterized protein LOC114364451 n=1 Tax=Ostrinia furnacalis TaxID=93504 RepID=UPI00103E0324|nr:uncharacterized protein LOC114364451 [Ostrinia furnacalis]